MAVILITVLAQNNMSLKCLITLLNTTAQTERSGSNPRLPPRCFRSSHPSLLRRKVAREYAAELVIDEAHATGVFGPRGRGVAAQLGIEKGVLAIVHTCGKALASMGAFVCSGLTLKQYLVNRARTFIFSTAMPPYLAHQIRAAMYLADAADAKRAHLSAIAELVRTKLRAAGLDVGSSNSHIIPVILGSNEIALHVARQL
ncbi:MAG: aminotransferase class I/II-fold pyridoxal phosphate-dependent enzyme, partial [Candidatus Acidiferrales bacterium]